ncbi:DNA methyltransferase [Cupriavidus basilensis]|uniref:DNA methyltransferase n=1 Tax=Cupriavidus basilensis TaxID=68895 RepID=UPI0039F741B8
MTNKNWTAGGTVKARRKAIGLSLEEMGALLGVSKAYMSYVESDERPLTEEQAGAISKILGIPSDLLLLSSGRLPGDVRKAISSDAAAVTATVRQRIEQRAVAYPTTLTAPLPELAEAEENTRTPKGIPDRIAVTKTTSSYRAHSYHTKVPPEAITPFIRDLTRPGDIVLDLFCGSGMTGVAALQEGRHAVLSDLSPAAVHIARNYTASCDPKAFSEALDRVAATIEPTMRWLYNPIKQAGQTVEYTTWSDVFRCGVCRKNILYWDVVQTTGGTDAKGVQCPHCQSYVRKSDLVWLAEMPVQTHVSAGSNRISSHAPTPDELSLIEEANSAPIPYWTPEEPFGPEREMWRASHRAMGIRDVSGFFTRRNLHALAALRHAIVTTSEGRIREALMFAFTACVNRASRRYQWNAKRPTNVMTGTLYISSLRYEWNVWSLFRRKAADVRRYYEAFPKVTSSVQVMNRSATDLSCIPSGSVSMVFFDPPFGSNIFYADSSILWEAWLGSMTDDTEEIVVNKSRARVGGGKTLDDYGNLMSRAFSEVARVLRPGGHAVLAFSNSDDQVWLKIQEAMALAGLETDTVHILDKGQPSIKGVKGVSGKENVTTLDLLITMKHRAQSAPMAAHDVAVPQEQVDRATLVALRSSVGRTDEIYSLVIQALLAGNYSLAGITMPLIAKRCIALGATEVEGKWVLPTGAGKSVDRDLVSEYIATKFDLPSASLSATPTSAPTRNLVPGGRNSALYTAHSYHTKVPPEAITPFIEHFTKTGDVVLDPFCGSGMTGVAAAMVGRNAILNDLSPAAVHLAWNHTHPCNINELQEAFNELEASVENEIRDIYGTTHVDGKRAVAHWVMWSTRHKCPACKATFSLWDATDRESGRMGSSISCPKCQTVHKRRDLPSIDSVPAWISYETEEGVRFEKSATQYDIKRALSFSRKDISTWFPSVPIGPDREMYIRCALHLKEIHEVADFYTPRNLQALSILWAAIERISNDRLRRALAFAFTNTAWHGTRMRRFNARGGQRPLTGTLYIPQLSSEVNVLEVMRNKIAQLKRYYVAYQPKTEIMPFVLNGSATNLSDLEDGSIDYIFTDPPFGSNLFYADCNLIWESWLGRITNPAKEAVVNRSLDSAVGGKTLKTYEALMTQAMEEMARVLKPGGWATVVFHNTDSEVWAALHKAADAVGFEFHEAASLDRKQQSHKGYKGRSGLEDVAHFDVVMNLRKSEKTSRRGPKTKGARKESLSLDVLIREATDDPNVAVRGIQGIHAEVVRRVVSTGNRVFFDYSEVREAWEKLSSSSKARNGLASSR